MSERWGRPGAADPASLLAVGVAARRKRQRSEKNFRYKANCRGALDGRGRTGRRRCSTRRGPARRGGLPPPAARGGLVRRCCPVRGQRRARGVSHHPDREGPAGGPLSWSRLVAAVLVRARDRARRLQDGLEGRGHDGTLRVWGPPGRGSPGSIVATASAVGCLFGAGPLHLRPLTTEGPRGSPLHRARRRPLRLPDRAVGAARCSAARPGGSSAGAARRQRVRQVDHPALPVRCPAAERRPGGGRRRAGRPRAVRSDGASVLQRQAPRPAPAGRFDPLAP